MNTFFAYAEPTDLSGSGWLLIMLCGAILVAICGLVLVPIRMARQGRLRKTDAITAVAALWGVIAAWSAMSFSLAQFAWNREWLLRVQTGYFDPKDTKGAPVWPWPLWGSLVLVYSMLVGLTIIGRDRQER